MQKFLTYYYETKEAVSHLVIIYLTNSAYYAMYSTSVLSTSLVILVRS
jgi:hypothetical protein